MLGYFYPNNPLFTTLILMLVNEFRSFPTSLLDLEIFHEEVLVKLSTN